MASTSESTRTPAGLQAEQVPRSQTRLNLDISGRDGRVESGARVSPYGVASLGVSTIGK
ncbi:hypothetical protein LNQ52_17605 [Klebsiella pneumoniae subsp. pneumoniae]|nr:hypothetical protein [Klebsiella pneumoniae subsp. pneumoniae]